MKDKNEQIGLGYEKASSMNQLDIHKQMLGEPVWVVRHPEKATSLPWKGTVTSVVDSETFLVKKFGSKAEEKVDMFDIRSVTKKKRV